MGCLPRLSRGRLRSLNFDATVHVVFRSLAFVKRLSSTVKIIQIVRQHRIVVRCNENAYVAKIKTWSPAHPGGRLSDYR